MSGVEAAAEHHWRSFAAADLSALMVDYTEESTMVSNAGTFSGDGIERPYDDLLTDVASQDADVTGRQQTVEEPFACLVRDADSPDRTYGFAAETLYVPEGTIRFRTFGVEVTGKE